MNTGDKDRPDKPPGANPGGVRHDARGNAVWQWAMDTGRHAVESTSRLLKRLEVPGLELEEDANAAPKKTQVIALPDTGSRTTSEPMRPKPGAVRAKPTKAAGYDPYGGATRGAAAGAKPTVTAKPTMKPVAAAPPRPSLLRRLFRRD